MKYLFIFSLLFNLFICHNLHGGKFIISANSKTPAKTGLNCILLPEKINSPYLKTTIILKNLKNGKKEIKYSTTIPVKNEKTTFHFAILIKLGKVDSHNRRKLAINLITQEGTYLKSVSTDMDFLFISYESKLFDLNLFRTITPIKISHNLPELSPGIRFTKISNQNRNPYSLQNKRGMARNTTKNSYSVILKFKKAYKPEKTSCYMVFYTPRELEILNSRPKNDEKMKQKLNFISRKKSIVQKLLSQNKATQDDLKFILNHSHNKID